MSETFNSIEDKRQRGREAKRRAGQIAQENLVRAWRAVHELLREAK